MVKLLDQLLQLQDQGMVVPELMTSLPPCIIKMGAETSEVNPDSKCNVRWMDDLGEEHIQCVGMEWAGGASCWRDSPMLGAVAREVLLEACTLYPYVNVTLDGGTWSSATGVRVSAERSSFLDSLNRYEHSRPFEWVWLNAGDTVHAYCERKRPGDVAFAELAEWGLATTEHGAEKLDKMTREPARVSRTTVEDEDEDDEPPAARETARPSGPRVYMGNAQQRAAQQDGLRAGTQRALAGEGREALTTWADRRTRTLSPRFGQLAWLASYVPILDPRSTGVALEAGHAGPRGRTGFEVPLEEPTFVRLPCVPEKMGSRPLPDAVWGDLNVVEHSCLCILHAGMRTGEHLFTHLLEVRNPDDH